MRCFQILRGGATTDADNPRRQIERAERLAASRTSETERIRFEAVR
jgi:hypothetical protein